MKVFWKGFASSSSAIRFFAVSGDVIADVMMLDETYHYDALPICGVQRDARAECGDQVSIN